MNYPVPIEALDDRLAFVGTSGSGKTYAAGTGVEKLLHGGARVIVVDPLDVWWGLRLSADGTGKGFDLPIFGGAHGDLPLVETAGKLIGETVARMAESCIVSLGTLGTKASERRFMLGFLEALYRNASGDPVHLIFDEADLWAPQKASEPMLQSRMEEIVRRGRVKGFIPWLITQRPAVLSKDVLSQADGLIALKLTSSQDRDAIGGWIDGQADREQGKAILASLPTMQRGEAVVWVPGRGVLQTAAFPSKATFDSSRTPKRGERRERKDLRPLNIDRLREKLANVETEIAASDPKALKAEVERLKRELTKAEKRIASPSIERVVANADEIEAARADGERAGIAIGIARARSAIDALRVDAPTVPPQAAKRTPRVRVESSHSPTGDVPTGCAKPLAALAAVYPSGLTEPQWALAAGYKRSGGTWGTYKSRLSSSGLIERRDGRWFATEAGAQAIGPVETPPSPGPELVRWWAARLPGTPRITEALIAAYPRSLSKAELAAAVDMSASGGSFGTYLSRLKGPGLISTDGGLVGLTDDVMKP